jgi:hypothetical protein
MSFVLINVKTKICQDESGKEMCLCKIDKHIKYPWNKSLIRVKREFKKITKEHVHPKPFSTMLAIFCATIKKAEQISEEGSEEGSEERSKENPEERSEGYEKGFSSEWNDIEKKEVKDIVSKFKMSCSKTPCAFRELTLDEFLISQDGIYIKDLFLSFEEIRKCLELLTIYYDVPSYLTTIDRPFSPLVIFEKGLSKIFNCNSLIKDN